MISVTDELVEALDDIAAEFSGRISNAEFLGTLDLWKAELLHKLIEKTQDMTE
jgi:hypothetical protein